MAFPTRQSRSLLVALMMLTIYWTGPAPAGFGQQPAVAPSVDLRVENGKVTCEVRGVTGSVLFSEAAERLGFTYYLDGFFATPVYASFVGEDQDQAIYLLSRACHAFPVKQAGAYMIYGPPDPSLNVNILPQLAYARPLRYVSSDGIYRNANQLYRTLNLVSIPDHNCLVVTGNQPDINQFLNVVDALDREPKNVLIQVLLVELDQDKEDVWDPAVVDFRRGLYAGADGLSGITVAPGEVPSVSVPYSTIQKLDGTEFTAQLNAIVSKGVARIVANPHVTASSGRQAQISVTTDETVVVTTRDNVGAVSADTEQISAGVRLSITPTVAAPDRIILQLDGEVSAFSQADVNAQFAVDRDTFNSEVIVKSGDTLVIGGLTQNTKQEIHRKVPLLGDLPFIGRFFRSKEKTVRRVEVLVFLTPYVLPITAEQQRLIFQSGDALEKKMDAQHITTLGPVLSPDPAANATPSQTSKTGGK